MPTATTISSATHTPTFKSVRTMQTLHNQPRAFNRPPASGMIRFVIPRRMLRIDPDNTLARRLSMASYAGSRQSRRWALGELMTILNARQRVAGNIPSWDGRGTNSTIPVIRCGEPVEKPLNRGPTGRCVSHRTASFSSMQPIVRPRIHSQDGEAQHLGHVAPMRERRLSPSPLSCRLASAVPDRFAQPPSPTASVRWSLRRSPRAGFFRKVGRGRRNG
jgi:hypothetical protein